VALAAWVVLVPLADLLVTAFTEDTPVRGLLFRPNR
jgi:hypothetical protein